MDSVCRTCLCIIKNGSAISRIDQLQPDCEVNDRQKLEACVPELSVDIVLEPVICETCKDNLALAFHFKTMCMETEKTLYGYIQQRRPNENFTNLLNPYDLLALVRNDIIQEHSYSSVKKSDDDIVKQPLVSEDFVGFSKDSQTDKNADAPEGDNSINKRTLRPRKYRYQIESKLNGNRLPSKTRMPTHTGQKLKKTFNCKRCNVSYKCKAHLVAHIRVHTVEKSLQGMRWPKRLQLNKYIQYRKNKQRKCSKCHNLFENFSSYQRHFKKYLGKCALPTEELSTENDIEISNHDDLTIQTRRSKRLQYFCKMCRRRFTTNFSLNRHIQQQHVLN